MTDTESKTDKQGAIEKSEFDMFEGEATVEPLPSISESKPCLGCGWCCMTDPCTESHRRYGYLRRCPDLLWDTAHNRYVCKLMLDPEQGADVKRSQHAGQGCYAPLNAWRNDIRNRDDD